MENNLNVPLKIGEQFTFSKTVGEIDVYMFAGITGDFAPNHINEEYMSKTPYKKRIAHGVLSIGYSSTTSSMLFDTVDLKGMGVVSYGYDRIRFIHPIFIGDTITVNYKIAEIDHENLKSIAKIEISNQNNELCTVGQHILKFIKES